MYNDPNWGGYAAASIDNATNTIATGTANKRTREWNEKILQQQRNWALEDWGRQNQYNHPSSQMARLREAGLNPNLVYGKGADVTAQPIRSTDAKALVYEKPQFQQASQVMAQSNNLALGKAQVDNLRVQNTVLANEALLKAVQTSGQATQNARGQFDLQQAQSLKQTSLDYARQNLESLMQDVFNKTKDFEIKSQTLAQSKTMAPLQVIEQQLKNQLSESQLKQFELIRQEQGFKNRILKLDATIADKGIRPSDPIYWRAINQLVQKIYEEYFK